MTLAEFYALQSVMDQDATTRDATARILALVPATAARLSMTIESLWAMDAAKATPLLAATIPTLLTADKAAELSPAAVAMQKAFSADAIAQLFASHDITTPSADDVSKDAINAELAKIGEQPLP